MNKKSLLSLILIVSMVISSLLYLGPINQIAQATESYSDDFSIDSGLWSYSGNAYMEIRNQSLVLTKSDYGQAGVAFFKHPISGSFTASFSYLVGEGTSGDSLIMFFYTQEHSTLGGSGLNYQSITPGYGIEFDGWPNWPMDFLDIAEGIINPPTGDPFDNYIGLIEGSVGNHLAYTANDPRVSDNIWHQVTVQVQESSVSVYVDQGLVLQWNGTLNRTYSGFGFTGNTGGGGTNYHIIDNFSITANALDDAAPNPTPTPLSRINTVTATITPFGKPCAVAMSPNGAYAYVANTYGDSSVSVINTATNKVTAKIPVESSPSAVAVSPNGAYIYVTIDRYFIYIPYRTWYNGSVAVINTATKNVAKTIPIGYNANGVAVSPNGAYAYVTNKGDGSVSVINTATNTVTATALVGSNVTGVVVSPNGEYVYVAGDSWVVVISTATNKVTATIPVGSDACAVAILPNGEYAYVTNKGDGSVSVVNTATNKVTATIPVGKNPSAVAVSPNGAYAYVTNEGDGSVSVINTATNTVNATIILGNEPGGFISVVLPSGSEEYVASSTRPVITEPCGVAVSPNGEYAYVTNYHSLTVSVISLATTSSSPSSAFLLLIVVTTVVIGAVITIFAYVWKKKT